MQNIAAEGPTSAVTAQLGFSRPEEVTTDTSGQGVKRAGTRPIDYPFAQQYEYRRCQIQDLCAAQQPAPAFRDMGFETIDLGASKSLQALLAQIHADRAVSTNQARQLRRCLQGAVFPLTQGQCLKILHVAPEGLIMRTGGPNGLQVEPDVKLSAMNGHDVALAVHGDQDVRGTPLKQMMRGFAPWMFRHQAPNGHNRWSPLVLVNLWIPLHQITRPLTLMDRRTLNGREHQLRYALPTDTFLDREQEMQENDIWAFLHDEHQRWYFHSRMQHDQAYVFDTLGTPHGSFVAPAEDIAEQYYLQLRQLSADLAAGVSVERPSPNISVLPDDTTEPLRQAIATMAALVSSPASQQSPQSIIDAWLAQAAAAMDSVVRKSLEMRTVALLLPNRWPFNRSRATV